MQISYSKQSRLIGSSMDELSIQKWEDYFELLGKKEKDWKDNQSAKSLAQYICGEGKFVNRNGVHEMKCMLGEVLNSDNINLYLSQAEYKVAFDNYNHKREHDLGILGTCNERKLFVGVEAKVDETFGKTVKQALAGISKNSNMGNRVDGLKHLFKIPKELDISECRYQLFYALAGCLPFKDYKENEIPSDGIYVCLFLTLHMLDLKPTKRSPKTRYEKNHDDLMSFLELFDKKEIIKLKSMDKIMFSAYKISSTRGNITVIEAHVYP